MKTLLDKKHLRKMALEKRNSMASTGATKIKSGMIVSKILNSIDFKNAKNIAIYYPIKNEIDITSLLNINTKNFFLPRCNGNDLEFCQYLGSESIKTGSYNIKEPISEKINPEILDIIYIPALMANKNNYRLGYGKGYYDRFFKNNHIKAKKVIVLANELISDDFKEELFDIPADLILSEI